MSSLSDLPELVRDSWLQTSVRDNETVHLYPSARRNRTRSEKWLRTNIIGHGGGGVVWLERNMEPGPKILRAVKAIDTNVDVMNVATLSRRFVRELEASAKFSQRKVS